MSYTEMDYEKYYDKRGDAYVIHFPNYKGRSVEELTKMFSAFGPVLSVEPRHGEFGLCFVRFQNLEDTIKCIHAFSNSKDIKILQHKHKMNSNSKNKSATNKKQTSQKTNKVNSTNANDSSQIFQNMKQSDCSSSVIERDSDPDTSITSVSSLKQLMQLKKLNKVKCSSSICSDISDCSTRITENCFTEDEIPSLIYSNKKKIIQAQEVIVANLHPALGVQEILTLFKDYIPICSSSIKQVPETEIRYCHTYFRTVEEALAIEKKFDKYLLRDRVLIVLRPQRLIEEALMM